MRTGSSRLSVRSRRASHSTTGLLALSGTAALGLTAILWVALDSGRGAPTADVPKAGVSAVASTKTQDARPAPPDVALPAKLPERPAVLGESAAAIPARRPRSVAFDASEGSRVDPLKLKGWDLSAPKTVPSFDRPRAAKADPTR